LNLRNPVRMNGLEKWEPGFEFGNAHSSSIIIFLQLDMISDLLGTPKPDDIRSACSGARAHMLKKPLKAPTLAALYTLSPQASPEAVHLLCQMLVFDPVRQA
jgi:nemo like kinase